MYFFVSDGGEDEGERVEKSAEQADGQPLYQCPHAGTEDHHETDPGDCKAPQSVETRRSQETDWPTMHHHSGAPPAAPTTRILARQPISQTTVALKGRSEAADPTCRVIHKLPQGPSPANMTRMQSRSPSWPVCSSDRRRFSMPEIVPAGTQQPSGKEWPGGQHAEEWQSWHRGRWQGTLVI